MVANCDIIQSKSKKWALVPWNNILGSDLRHLWITKTAVLEITTQVSFLLVKGVIQWIANEQCCRSLSIHHTFIWQYLQHRWLWQSKLSLFAKVWYVSQALIFENLQLDEQYLQFTKFTMKLGYDFRSTFFVQQSVTMKCFLIWSDNPPAAAIMNNFQM